MDADRRIEYADEQLFARIAAGWHMTPDAVRRAWERALNTRKEKTQ